MQVHKKNYGNHIWGHGGGLVPQGHTFLGTGKHGCEGREESLLLFGCALHAKDGVHAIIHEFGQLRPHKHTMEGQLIENCSQQRKSSAVKTFAATTRHMALEAPRKAASVGNKMESSSNWKGTIQSGGRK